MANIRWTPACRCMLSLYNVCIPFRIFDLDLGCCTYQLRKLRIRIPTSGRCRRRCIFPQCNSCIPTRRFVRLRHRCRFLLGKECIPHPDFFLRGGCRSDRADTPNSCLRIFCTFLQHRHWDTRWTRCSALSTAQTCLWGSSCRMSAQFDRCMYLGFQNSKDAQKTRKKVGGFVSVSKEEISHGCAHSVLTNAASFALTSMRAKPLDVVGACTASSDKS